MNPRPLGTFGAVAVIAALAFGSPAALSQDNRPRDSGGFKMDLSSWRSIPTHEFVLNIVDLPGAEFISAERRVRDHALVHQRVWFDGPQGFLFVEHLPSTRGYNRRSSNNLRSAWYARKTAERYWRGAGEPFDVEESAEIHTSRRRGGWVHATRGRNYGRLCFIARVGFLSRRWKVKSRKLNRIPAGPAHPGLFSGRRGCGTPPGPPGHNPARSLSSVRVSRRPGSCDAARRRSSRPNRSSRAAAGMGLS